MANDQMGEYREFGKKAQAEIKRMVVRLAQARENLALLSRACREKDIEGAKKAQMALTEAMSRPGKGPYQITVQPPKVDVHVSPQINMPPANIEVTARMPAPRPKDITFKRDGSGAIIGATTTPKGDFDE